MTVELIRTLSQEQFDRLFGAAVESLETWQLHDALDMMEEAVLKRIGSFPKRRKEEKKRDRRRTRRSAKTRKVLAEKRQKSYEPQKDDGKRPWGTYDEYLKSPEWQALRSRILSRDLGTCLACGNHANCVHHRSYDRHTMAGQRLHKLVSLCGECHQHVHFIDDEKLSMEVVDQRLCELITQHERSWCVPAKMFKECFNQDSLQYNPNEVR